MKLNVNEKGNIVLEEVFAGLSLKSEDGEEFGICMRDSGFEFQYGNELWQAKDGKVQKIGTAHTSIESVMEEMGHVPDGLRMDIILEGLQKGISVPITFEPTFEPKGRIIGDLFMDSEGYVSVKTGTTEYYGKKNPTEQDLKDAWEKLKIKFNNN